MSAPENFDELPTEQVHDASRELDLLDTVSMLRVINDEDAKVATAVRQEIPTIAVVVDRTAERLAAGGRWHAFGAGTSGRIALLDAVECPPTFGVSHDLFQGHMAGGIQAFARAVEGAEDDPALGAAAVTEAGIGSSDVVCALSASGRAPFCLGALEAARESGALTVAISSNPDGPLAAAAELAITPRTGPEVLSGSTRMKAGTAQKLVLNMISTGVMVKLGHSYGAYMVGVVPGNEKLRRRAERLIENLCGETDQARPALESAEGDVRVAVLMIRHSLDVAAAAAKLAAAGGSLRRALEA